MFATSIDASGVACPRQLPSAVVVEEQAVQAFEEYFFARTHSKKALIRKILIGGERLEAVKGIRALRQWSYQHFRSHQILHLVAMATPDDIAANAEHMRLADEFVHVPGGSVLNNNVDLVVNIAVRCGVHAVWPGCGGMAANVKLPTLLRAHHIAFVGPTAQAMESVTNKVNSLVIAQTLGIRTLPWSGSELEVPGGMPAGSATVPPEVASGAWLTSRAQAETCAEAIGFPVLVHPSHKSPGSAAWCISSKEELVSSFLQFESETSSTCSVMMQKKPAEFCRVEVQVIADKRGAVIALTAFDCSIQIQDQNTISEGPPAEVPPHVQEAMESQAVALARQVGYCGVGTVAYVYKNGSFFMLGLAPCLHEDFPLVEAVTGVNLVAAQLHIAMDVPLQCIPDIRRLYGVHADGLDLFDFNARARGPAVGHCIAARITAHDPGWGFEHSHGRIQEIRFSSHPGVFLYFSVGNAGFLRQRQSGAAKHVFAHVFAHAPSRSEAVPKLATALMEMVVLGDVVCDSKHLASILEQPEFLFTAHYAAWLNSGGMVQKVVGGRVPQHVAVLCGAVVKAHMRRRDMEELAVSLLHRGVSPDITQVNFSEHAFDLVLDHVKYLVQVAMGSPSMFVLKVNSDVVEAEAVMRSDGGLLVLLDGRTYTVYYENMKDGFKVHINGHRCFFPDDFDPTCLTTPYPGKLLRFLVEEGQRITAGQPFAEVELMKTVVPLLSGTSGIVHLVAAKGAQLRTGDILCRVTLENGVEVPRVDVFRGGFPPVKPCRVDPESMEGNTYLQFQHAYEEVFKILMGYNCADDPLAKLLRTLTSPSLVLFDFKEQVAAAASHASGHSSEALAHIEQGFQQVVTQGSKVRAGVRGDDIVVTTRELARLLDKQALAAHPTPSPELVAFVARYKDGLYRHEVQVVCQIIAEFLRVESTFSEVPTFEDAMLKLAEQHSDNLYACTSYAHSHSKLHQKLELVLNLLAHVDSLGMVEVPMCLEHLQRCAALSGVLYGEVASRAKAIIIKKQEYVRYSARRWKNMKKSISSTMLELNNMTEERDKERDTSSPEDSESASDNTTSTSNGEAANGAPTAIATSLSSDDVSSKRLRHVTIQLPSEESLPNMPPPWQPRMSSSPRLSSPTPVTVGAKKSIFQRMKERTNVMRNEIELSEVQSTMPGKSMTSMTDHFIMINALFNRADPAVATNAIKKMFEFQGINDVVCTVEEMGVIRAHMTNSTDTWILGNMEEAMFVLSNKLGENYYQCVGLVVQYPELLNNPNRDDLAAQLLKMVSTASAKGHIPRDLGVVFVSLLEPTNTHGMAQFHFRRSPPGGRTWCEDTNVREIPAAFVAFMELSRLSCFNASLIAASDSTYSSLSIPLPPITHKIEYSTLIFLATEKKPPLKGTRRDHRIFLRTMVHNKELFLGSSDDAARAAEPNGLTARSPKSMAKTRSMIFSQQGSLRRASLASLANKRDAPSLESVMGEERVLGDLLAQMELAVMSKKTAFNYIFVNLTDSTQEDIPAVKQTITAFLDQCRRDLRRLRVAWIEVKVGPGRLVAYNPNGYQFKMEFHTDAKPPLPYPVLNRIQRKRMYAQSLGTTFVYDFVDMFYFQADYVLKGMVNIYDSSCSFSSQSNMAGGVSFKAVELVLNSEGALEEIERPIGCNDVGMVVWRCKVQTHEYPMGRSFILVANDITHIGGSFSPEEDDVYEKAVNVARRYQIPLVHISANSGARVGLDEAVKACFRVEWEDPADYGRGVKYFYLTHEDYVRVCRTQKVVATKLTMPDGACRWRLDDAVGGIGHECLQGSAQAASATSAAYHDIFTLTFVTGRAIGIGAYIARLSTRVIQHQDAPLILTGYATLNKILGREVYCNNNQIGGPKVMYHNGVAHMVVQDDLQGVGSILQWLSYIPSKKGAPLPHTPTGDPIERLVDFFPSRAPHDPRLMLQSMFDEDTFQECMAEWGKTVITGRGRLGGLPIGIVAVENRVVEKMVPADPAFAGAQQLVEQQPGQVWFPDSAFKTAQAIQDFNLEGLPLIIFANWRGFAGGLRDMFGEVLKYGSMIVDNLRVFKQPVMVYIPYEAEIRGGAWVVIDKSINPEQMEMYCAEVCRGGVLEPEATAQLKFKEQDMIKAMHRMDPNLATLSFEEQESMQSSLMPAYRHMSIQFAAIHDNPRVMLEKNIIKAVVPWAESRSFFAKQLRRRLAQEALKSKVREAWPGPSAQSDQCVADALAQLSNCIEAVVDQEGEVRMDFVDVVDHVKKIRKDYISHKMAELMQEDEATVKDAWENFQARKEKRRTSHHKDVGDRSPRMKAAPIA